MLGKLTINHFKGKEGSEFVTQSDQGQPLTFTLTEVEALKQLDNHPLGDGARAPFSLIFQGPENVDLRQGTISLSHADFESELPIFLVAIGKTSDAPYRLTYQAIFN